MLYALKPVPVQEIFERDSSESRRTALKGEKLGHVLVAYQMVRQPGLRGLIRATEGHTPLQKTLGEPVARNTLANARTQRPVRANFSVTLGRGQESPGRRAEEVLATVPLQDWQTIAWSEEAKGRSFIVRRRGESDSSWTGE
jgi:hypothetical protein